MFKTSISISITVYNIEKYVEKCINSILNQDFTDFEFIIIDDGSTDNSGEICKKYERMDKRITYIYQRNQGVSSARNLAIDIAKGKYILLVDGDDQLEKIGRASCRERGYSWEVGVLVVKRGERLDTGLVRGVDDVERN